MMYLAGEKRLTQKVYYNISTGDNVFTYHEENVVEHFVGPHLV